MGGVEKGGKARNVRGVTFIVLLTWNVCLSLNGNIVLLQRLSPSIVRKLPRKVLKKYVTHIFECKFKDTKRGRGGI